MNEFVNYRKRKIALAKRRKDRNEVLRSQDRREIQACAASTALSLVGSHESIPGTLSEIGRYVERVFASRACVCLLVIGPLDERLTLDVGRIEDGHIWASATVQQSSIQERAVRKFFERWALDIPKDSVLDSMFIPNVPVHGIFAISPFPARGPVLSELITELFREVCGAQKQTELRFWFFEK